MFGGLDVDCLLVSMTTVGRQQSATAVSWPAGSLVRRDVVHC